MEKGPKQAGWGQPLPPPPYRQCPRLKIIFFRCRPLFRTFGFIKFCMFPSCAGQSLVRYRNQPDKSLHKLLAMHHHPRIKKELSICQSIWREMSHKWLGRLWLASGYIQINRNKSRRPSCTTKATGTSGPENRSTPSLLLNQTVFYKAWYFCRYFDRAWKCW